MPISIEKLEAAWGAEHAWLRPCAELCDDLTLLWADEAATAAFMDKRFWFIRNLIHQLCEIMGVYYQCQGARNDLLPILRRGLAERDAAAATARLGWLSEVYSLFGTLARGQQRVFWDEMGAYLRDLGFALAEEARPGRDAAMLSEQEEGYLADSGDVTDLYREVLALVRDEWDAVAEALVPQLRTKASMAAELGALMQRCYAAFPLQHLFAQKLGSIVEAEETLLEPGESTEPIEIERFAVLQLVMDYFDVYPASAALFHMFMNRLRECICYELKNGRPVHLLLDYVLERAAAFFAARKYSECKGMQQTAWHWGCDAYKAIFRAAVQTDGTGAAPLLYYLECAEEAVRILPNELHTWHLHFAAEDWKEEAYQSYLFQSHNWGRLYRALARQAAEHPDPGVRASAEEKMKRLAERFDAFAWELIDMDRILGYS